MGRQQWLQKAEELKKSLVSQQTMFSKVKSQSEAAVKASYVAREIVKSAQSFPVIIDSLCSGV